MKCVRAYKYKQERNLKKHKLTRKTSGRKLLEEIFMSNKKVDNNITRRIIIIIIMK